MVVLIPHIYRPYHPDTHFAQHIPVAQAGYSSTMLILITSTMSLPIPALLLSLLAAPLAVSAQASRPQVVPTTMTVAAVGGAVTVTLDLPNSPIKPTGLANEGYVMGNTPVPLVCHSVCQTSQPYYA